MRATVADCVVRLTDPAGLGERSALVGTLRAFCRFGVERFVLLSADPAACNGLDRCLPKPVRIDVQPPDAPAPSPPYLLCDAGARFPANLGHLLRQAALRPEVPKHRLMLRLQNAVADSSIRLVRGAAAGVADILCDPVAAGEPRALFLDRDGVLNVDHGYVGSRDRFEWTDGALDAIRAAADAGWHVFIVTNQSGVARGLYDEPAVRGLLDWIADEARRAGGTIDDARYCPYHPEATLPAYRQAHPWRKPAAGMLLDLMRVWGIDAARAVMVGDQQTDMQAAAAAGVAGHLFGGGNLLDFLRPVLAATVSINPMAGGAFTSC